MSERSTDPRSLLRTLEQSARKRFGQNFLTEPGIADRIARGARIQEGDQVVEIGPGLGMLTESLIATGADVTAVELDRDLAAYLEGRGLPVRIIQNDALKVDWDEVLDDRPCKVVANLPYNVGTKIVMQLLRSGKFKSITVMLQKEVIDRICAAAGSRTYGALSVEAQVRAEPVYVMKVPPGAFHPRPKVTSAVVRLQCHEAPQTGGTDPRHFDRVVRAAFSQRRKTLLNSLGTLWPRDVVRDALGRAGIDSGLRAEAVDLNGYRALAKALVGSTMNGA